LAEDVKNLSPVVQFWKKLCEFSIFFGKRNTVAVEVVLLYFSDRANAII